MNRWVPPTGQALILVRTLPPPPLAAILAATPLAAARRPRLPPRLQVVVEVGLAGGAATLVRLVLPEVEVVAGANHPLARVQQAGAPQRRRLLLLRQSHPSPRATVVLAATVMMPAHPRTLPLLSAPDLAIGTVRSARKLSLDPKTSTRVTDARPQNLKELEIRKVILLPLLLVQ